MTKWIRRVAGALLALALLIIPAWGTGYDYGGQMEGFFEESGAGELVDKVPEEAKDLMDRMGMEGIGGTVEGFTPRGLAQAAWDTVRSSFGAPGRLLVSLTGILVLCAMLESFGATFTSGGVETVFGVVVTVFISSIIIDPIVACVVDAREVIQDFALFILSFIPVFAGVVSASGQPMTGTAYNLFVFWMCQVTAQLVTAVFLPLLCAYLALSLISVVCPGLKLGGFIGGIKTFVTWSLGLILTVFIGLMSVQSVVASGGDSIAAKTTKFFIGSMIPVVGGALSDLFAAAQGCIQLVKGTLGAFGIAVTALTFLPVLVRNGAWYLTLQLGGLVSELLGLPQITRLLKALSSTIGIILAVLLYDALLVIISTTLLIVTFRGG